eukprot:TRINITY_DN14001_c0_g1_i20.p1 TRINITY_DN14001_c0_g1~~TRINITY_DN14001_c0_g1_i20.p1  ORF type:complete len:199 (-),score=46.95 TRINITY_DN14001_c0_g1_i20:48-644(-)
MRRAKIEITVTKRQPGALSFRHFNSKLEEARRRKKSADNRSTSIVNQLTSITSAQEIWSNFKRTAFNTPLNTSPENLSKRVSPQPMHVVDKEKWGFGGSFRATDEVRLNTPVQKSSARNFIPMTSTHSTEGLLIKEGGSERKESLMKEAWKLHQVLTARETEDKKDAAKPEESNNIETSPLIPMYLSLIHISEPTRPY